MFPGVENIDLAQRAFVQTPIVHAVYSVEAPITQARRRQICIHLTTVTGAGEVVRDKQTYRRDGRVQTATNWRATATPEAALSP